MTKYLHILKDWNLWDNRPDIGVERSYYLDKLINWIDLPEIIALYGVRRSGKSTILLQLIEKLHKKNHLPYENFLFINFEDPRLGETLLANDLFNIYSEYLSNLKPKGRVYLLLDEVQRVKEWERFILSLYEQKKNVKIFITGSSSSLLSSKLSSLLSGRMLLQKVMPLNFQEFLQFKRKKTTSKKEKLQLLDEYLMYGGFPRVVLEDNKINKRSILNSYYDTILEKDVILRNRLKKKTELKNLARYIMSNNGSILSTYALERILNISSENISKFITMLTDAFLIFENNYFSYSVKKQIYNPRKIYSVDTGLANTAGFHFSENKGRLLENIVYIKLRLLDKKIYYWKNSTEIDFVIFSGNTIEELINVTLTADEPSVLNRELTSLESAGKELSVTEQSLLSLYNESGQKNPRIKDLLDFLEK